MDSRLMILVLLYPVAMASEEGKTTRIIPYYEILTNKTVTHEIVTQLLGHSLAPLTRLPRIARSIVRSRARALVEFSCPDFGVKNQLKKSRYRIGLV